MDSSKGKIKRVVKRSGAVVPFKPSRISNAIYRAAVAVGGRNKEIAENLSQKVIEALEEKCPEGCDPHIEEVQDLVEKILIENGHAKVAKAFIIYREEAARRRHADAKHASKPSDNIPWAKLWHILDWSVAHNLGTVESYNERVRGGEFAQIVHESESAYEEDLDTASEMIIERSGELKMVMVSGPSSSGKTTTTFKLEKRLEKNGLKFVSLIVDNYFFDLELHPKDEFGDYDFETPQALDLELINDHLKKLSDGEEVQVPFYDFKSGKRMPKKTPLRLNENEILLIDSLHGLYPPMTEGIPDAKKFKLYLEPLLQMKDAKGNFVQWTDLRMIRRMLRDSVHRAYNPQQTLEHWHYVRSSELRNIIPNIPNTDFIINSSMPYELSLYSSMYLEKFRKWEEEYKDDPLREDAYMRASRIRNLLEAVVPVEDDSPVPKDSVLREFIGGSVLEI